MSIQKVFENTKKYLSPEDHKLVERAYQFAKAAHGDEKRLSKEPYILHPTKVAYSLSVDRLDAPTIAAALLHDVPENTALNLEQIRKEFGQETADLVDGVTKLGKVKLKKQWFFPVNLIDKITGEEKRVFAQQVDNLRKMVLAMAKDVRVILVKLADRLDNMKSLKYLPPEKRVRIAKETMEIYAPIAYRLGIGGIQSTLEDLSFPYVYPKEYQRIKKLIGKRYEEKEIYVKKLKKNLAEELIKHNIKYEAIDGRRKHLYSLWRKASFYNYDINKIYDLVALRIIVYSIEDCYKVLGIIHNKYRPLIGRIKDYIAVAKPNGYRSLHTTVFGPGGGIVEIQIRTSKMHEQAEFGVAAHWHYTDYKHTNNHDVTHDRPRGITSKLQTEWLEELGRWQEKMNDPQEWSNGLKMDFFRNQIFVFTPAGDVQNLPVGATPVDFAYVLHSGLGDSCRGSIVDGKIAKLNQPLKNGQIVEIIKDKRAKGPKKDWLRFVKTHRARGRIKTYFGKK